MNKILLIIKREYLTKVRKKTFIISTLLFPLLYLGLIFGIGYLGEKSKKNLTVAVVDSSGYFDAGRIARANGKDSSSVLVLTNMKVDSLKENLGATSFDAFVVIPAIDDWKNGLRNIPLQADKTLGMETAMPVQSKLNNIWGEIKNEKLGISDSTINQLESSQVTIKPVNINDENADSKIAGTIGYVAGFLIYFILLIYGSQVMMGVMEEKTNRIAEVIVSSVKPFQLMLGKILGIGLVALTQFFLWIAFIFIVYNVTKASGAGDSVSGMVGGVQKVFSSINVPLVLFCFVFYFLGGFFFYSSLYAAIGSAVNEDMREAQSLSFPVTMLVIFSIALMSMAMNDPTGPIAVWGSIIPFSSPIVMMARIPYGVPGTVPWWHLGLSMALLIAGFVFTTWFAGKIYRTGILMYGKKPTWKELIKWAFRKN
ncbi:MAG: ABC transporter permease [Chitinophagaceae bacterium]|nr:ABC transporter permease [Chitinophagaceae bacterium]